MGLEKETQSLHFIFSKFSKEQLQNKQINFNDNNSDGQQMLQNRSNWQKQWQPW